MADFPLPLTESEKVYIEKLIHHLNEGSYVFILGPGGMGKTTVIKEALPELEKMFGIRCYFFDLKEAQKGANHFYNHILEKISGNRIKKIFGDDLSNDFIQKLENYISHPTLLIFDNFRAINRDFYDQFSVDCRKIKMMAESDPNSGLNNILMVFSGSLIASGHETSPLFNITEKIEILLLPQKEAKIIIKHIFLSLGVKAPSSQIIDIIYDYTLGHRYLSVELVRFVVTKKLLKQGKKIEHIFQAFIQHIWEVINKSEDVLQMEDKELRSHFINIMEYLETSSEILRVVLDLQERKSVRGPKLPRLDNTTVTGTISKDSKGKYYFSNKVYKEFFELLLQGYRKGNLCLFHIDEDDFWKRAKDIFHDLQVRRIERVFNEPVTPSQRRFSFLVRKLIQRMRSRSTSIEFINEFNDMLDLIFDIPAWASLMRVDKSPEGFKLGGIDTTFSDNHPIHKQISESELNKQCRELIVKSIKKKSPMVDWTGQWLTIPTFIREDFARIFLVKINPNQQAIIPRLTTFVQESLWAYYSISVKEKSQEKVKRLQDRISRLEDSKKPYIRDEFRKPWSIIKKNLRKLGICEFTLHEVLNQSEVLSNKSSQELPSRGKERKQLKNSQKLVEAVANIKNGESYIPLKTNRHLVGKALKNGVILIIEFKLQEQIKKGIMTELESFFELFTLAIENILENYDNKRDLEMLRRALIGTDDYFFLIDKERKIIYTGKKLEQLFKGDVESSRNFYGRKSCCKFIDFKRQKCPNCNVEKVFEGKEVIRTFEKVMLAGKERFLDYTFVPILDERNDQVIAVGVFMHDVGIRQRLWEVLVELQKIENISQMEILIFDTLTQFGFTRVFKFKPDPVTSGRYISEDYRGEVKIQTKGNNFKSGKINLISKDEVHIKGRVSVWYRRNTYRSSLKEFLDNRLRNSGFDLKPSQSQPPAKKNMVKPDFWVTVPITGREGVVKLYVLDNWGNDKNDREVISLDRLQALETFGQAAGQIMENIRRWRNFQAMLSHGTMEPLQIMRLFLDQTASCDDRKERELLVKRAEGALGFAQSALGSILTIGRGPDRIHSEKIAINDLMWKQTSLFEAYAGLKGGIQFDLQLPDKTIFWKTDPVVLTQILNNLTGNAIRHLDRLDRKTHTKKIFIKVTKESDELYIEVSDNGQGLPLDVKEYFKHPYQKGRPFPTGGIGLGFSRIMVHLLQGSMELQESSRFVSGTTFHLKFKEF